MSDVKVGDLIRITAYQHAASVGEVVPVTRINRSEGYVTYRWKSPEGTEDSDDWYADMGYFVPVSASPDQDSPSVLIEDCYFLGDEPVTQVDCESPWPSDKLAGEKSPPEDDPVNHPSHYTFGQYEVLDVIEDWNLSYHLGNATKYIARAGRKDPAKERQDLEKAVFYIQRRISQLPVDN